MAINSPYNTRCLPGHPTRTDRQPGGVDPEGGAGADAGRLDLLHLPARRRRRPSSPRARASSTPGSSSTCEETPVTTAECSTCGWCLARGGSGLAHSAQPLAGAAHGGLRSTLELRGWSYEAIECTDGRPASAHRAGSRRSGLRRLLADDAVEAGGACRCSTSWSRCAGQVGAVNTVVPRDGGLLRRQHRCAGNGERAARGGHRYPRPIRWCSAAVARHRRRLPRWRSLGADQGLGGRTQSRPRSRDWRRSPTRSGVELVVRDWDRQAHRGRGSGDQRGTRPPPLRWRPGRITGHSGTSPVRPGLRAVADGAGRGRRRAGARVSAGSTCWFTRLWARSS